MISANRNEVVLNLDLAVFNVDPHTPVCGAFTTTLYFDSNISIMQAKGSHFSQKNLHFNMKYGLLHLHLFLVKSAINPLKSSIYYSHVKHDLRVTNVIVEEVGTNCYPLSSKSCPNIPKPPNTLP